jgi:hypothetical protein
LTDPYRRDGVRPPVQRVNPTTIAIIGGALLLALLAAFLFLHRGNEDQDKLTGSETATAAASPERRCASQSTYNLIKRELFRRAAQVRGSDQPAFDKLAAYAAVRMERPVLESEDGGTVNCSGSLSLDLPPGVAVVGGRRTLTADIDYSLQRAADGSGEVLTLGGADAIITPLATLARVAPKPTATPAPPLNTADPGYDGPGEVAPAAPDVPPVYPPPPARTEPATARPSFNCANAKTRGEIAVCNDSGLAALDRQMASHFNRAMAAATPGERTMLTRSRDRFLAFRDRCASDACIADAYRGRIAEITDIMSGQFRP